ncbi:MAG: hypothetical protein KAV87_35705 [Desulfobacteraceae bacterium]|nr:hypothetical protein [Desulfobacteraceae bacterium]
MDQISNLKDNYKQSVSFALEDGTDTATLTLHFHSNMKAWYMDLEYGDFVLKNRRLYSNPNILRQWRKILPFGLSCFCLDNQDPYFVTDFKNLRAYIYVLTSQEVRNYENHLSALKDEA